MQSFFTTLATAFLGLMVSVGLVSAPVPSKTVGAALPSTPALVDTFLAANMSANDTSMTLANGTTNDGTALAGYMCFTIDANTPTVEYVCGTASSTSVTGLTRGIDLTNPTSTTTRAYTHRRFASVQTTDYPTLQLVVRKLNGVDTFDSVLSYTSTTPSSFTSTQDLASKGYVDNQIMSGGVPITTSTPGIGLLATPAQTAAGTATGTYNSQTYNLLPANSTFNQTSSASNIVPVTGSNGKLSQGFLDLTQPFTFSGGVTSSATTTLSGNTTISGTTTVSAPVTFSNTATFSGSVFGAGFTHIQTVTTTGTSTWTRPAGVSKIQVIVVGGGGNGGSGSTYQCGAGGGGGGSAMKILDVSSIPTTTITVGAATATSSFGSYVSATGGTTGGLGAYASGGSGGVGSGGDINITGNGGGGCVLISGPYYLNGVGGSSILGGGAPAGVTAGSSAGNAGGNYGGGGSGGAVATGGAGAPGIVIVYY